MSGRQVGRTAKERKTFGWAVRRDLPMLLERTDVDDGHFNDEG